MESLRETINEFIEWAEAQTFEGEPIGEMLCAIADLVVAPKLEEVKTATATSKKLTKTIMETRQKAQTG